jgi:hypothetical protein
MGGVAGGVSRRLLLPGGITYQWGPSAAVMLVKLYLLFVSGSARVGGTCVCCVQT